MRRRSRKAGGKPTHDYSKPARPVAVEGEEEEVVIPVKERRLPFFVSYRLLGDDLSKPVDGGEGYDLAHPVRGSERIEALSKQEAEKICKLAHPDAQGIMAQQATIVLYWRPKDSKEKWDMACYTSITSTNSYQKEVEILDYIQADYERQPILLGRGESLIPEFKRVEYHNIGEAPEEL